MVVLGPGAEMTSTRPRPPRRGVACSAAPGRRGLDDVEPASVVADPHDNDAADRPGLEPEAAGLRVSLTAFQEAPMKTLCAAATSAGLKNSNGTLKFSCVWMPKYSLSLLRRLRR